MEPSTSEELLARSIGDQEGNGLALCSILAMLEKISLQLFVIGNQQPKMLSGAATQQLDLLDGLETPSDMEAPGGPAQSG